MPRYATHIFDGLDDWPTHLHYLNNKGCTGWQGKIEDNEFYQNLRVSGVPSPMLRTAEFWLREEIVEMRKLKELEKAAGQSAILDSSPLLHPDNSSGGFSSGRMAAYNFIGQK